MENVNVFVNGYTGNGDNQYKTVYLKANIPFAEQVANSNTKYVVKWNFDLNGERVDIPEHCIIQFDGGSANNGTIVLGPWSSIFGSNTGTRCNDLFIELHAQSHVKGLDIFHYNPVPIKKGIISFDYKRVYEDLAYRSNWLDKIYVNTVNVKIEDINFLGGCTDDRYDKLSVWYTGSAILIINYLTKTPLTSPYSKGFYDFWVSNCKIEINLLTGIYCDTYWNSWMTALHFDKIVFGHTNYCLLLNREIDDDPESSTYKQDIKHGFYASPINPEDVIDVDHRGILRLDHGQCNNIKITDCELQCCKQTYAGIKMDGIRDVYINGSDFWDFYEPKYLVPYLVSMDSNCYGLTIDKVADLHVLTDLPNPATPDKNGKPAADGKVTSYDYDPKRYHRLYEIRNENKTYLNVTTKKDSNGQIIEYIDNISPNIPEKYREKITLDKFKYQVDGGRDNNPYTGGFITIGKNIMSGPCFRLVDIFPECADENHGRITFGDIYNNIPSGAYYIPSHEKTLIWFNTICANLGLIGQEYIGNPEPYDDSMAYILEVKKESVFCIVHIYEIKGHGEGYAKRSYDASFYWSISLENKPIRLTSYDRLSDHLLGIDLISTVGKDIQFNTGSLIYNMLKYNGIGDSAHRPKLKENIEDGEKVQEITGDDFNKYIYYDTTLKAFLVLAGTHNVGTRKDGHGNIIYKKDENGNLIYKKDENGNYLKDENNNYIKIPEIYLSEMWYYFGTEYEAGTNTLPVARSVSNISELYSLENHTLLTESFGKYQCYVREIARPVYLKNTAGPEDPDTGRRTYTNKWVYADGIEVTVKTSGNYSDIPAWSEVTEGFQFMLTLGTVSRPIYYAGRVGDTAKWVYADGTEVTNSQSSNSQQQDSEPTSPLEPTGPIDNLHT